MTVATHWASIDPLALVCVAAALALAAGLTHWLVHRSGPWLQDKPNERSLHRTPVPRSGGLAVLAGTALPLFGLWVAGLRASELTWLGAAALPVAVVSLWDDFGHVSRRLRLAAHLASASILIAGGLAWSALDLPGLDWSMPALLAWPLTLLYVVWSINLYNFMDGMDGFAGGMALFGFGALAVLGWQGGEFGFAVVAACVAAAAGGFLTGNFPPARIFLGDLGSSLLGLMAAGLALWGTRLELFPLWVAWLAFSPFIVDATWTLLRRALAGERIWEAHRSHHYQRLVLAGWGHRKTVLRAYALMAGAGACAIAAPALPVRDQWTLIAAWAAIYVLIHVRVGLAERGSESGYP
jgi:UDP-N-acetylmuramyl pentapeptide phosphotransferase/UDP-N-acetylglucosamine-1-phosphate transferase